MYRKAAACLHRARKIVMLLADFRRRMLESPGDEANLLRGVHSQKSRCGPTEVMKAHGLSEVGAYPLSSNGIQAVPTQSAPAMRDPQSIARAAAKQDWSYL